MAPSTKHLLCTSFFIVAVFLNKGSFAQDYAGSNSSGVQTETRLSAVEDQMRSLNGKVETLEYAIRRLDQSVQKFQADAEARMAKLETAPPPAPQSMAPHMPPSPAGEAAPVAEAPQQDVSGTLGNLNMRGEKVTGGAVKPKAPALPEAPADYGLTAQEQYDRAFGLLRQASYDEAEKAFKSFIDKNPKDKLLDNAKYWYAETFYVRGKFGDAAVSFAEAYEQNAKGTKAPDSLLKLAMSLASLDKPQDACATLGALKSKFPNAPATIKTRTDQERARLKCGNTKP